MKTRFVGLVLFLIYSCHAFSQEMSIPQISKPVLLEEGTQRSLTQEQIDELIPWTKNSKIAIQELLFSIEDLSIEQKIFALKAGIRFILSESKTTSELFMRYSLQRALVVEDIISKETDTNTIGISDVKYRVLINSIGLALKYYDQDFNSLQNDSKMAFAQYGTDYFMFLLNLNKSIFDASAQFEIHKITLEWLAWDLYRDLNNRVFASPITRIYHFLKTIPSEKLNDQLLLLQIRKMRNFQESLNVSAIIKNLEFKESARELKKSERVLVLNRQTGYLRPAVVYANVSDTAPGATKESKNTHYCVKFTSTSESERYMAYENFVKREDILIASGCGEKLCVGTNVIEKKTNRIFAIIGIDVNGNYAIASGKFEMIGVSDRDLKKAE